MTLDVLGVSRLPFWKKRSYQEFAALKDINLEVLRGQRIGIVGRNGAGKTTLLKLITGNFQPTAGRITVNGQVQALMDMGLGFHQELSGLDNIKASLIYNGLSSGEIEDATADIIEFAELGDYLFQPLKTYSLGMQARLGFATATAIKPDILIIDEVLGAGDGYFAAKSAERMKQLTGNGVTLLLVSHSTPQIVQFCETAIWIDKGRIVENGDAMEVVKAYDAYLRSLDEKRIQIENSKRIDKRLKGSPESTDAQSRAAQAA
ncbi:MAG: ABC transporter ATP-binding protein, partial [Betaproteobacteria bacterium]